MSRTTPTPRVTFDTLEPRAFFSAASAWAAAIDNPYLPMLPGMSWLYRGTKDGAATRNRTVVLPDTATVDGVTCTVVFDRLFQGGRVIEKTYDYYAQDRAGNVWYFGEASTEVPGGSTAGSWTAGVGGALPGIVMEAQPKSGDTYRQEYAPPDAEDMASVTSQSWHLTVPHGSYSNVLVTKETSCVESGVEHKYYAQGVGLLQVVAVSSGKNGSEQLQLTAIR